jgi:hypothetical protein
MKDEKLTVVLGIRVTEKMKEALCKMAHDEERRLSDILRKELQELLERKSK